MQSLDAIGEVIAKRRRSLGLRQSDLAKLAKIGLSTLDALENGRLGELGFSKILRLLTVLELGLKVEQTASHRPTLDQLLSEHIDEERQDPNSTGRADQGPSTDVR